MKKVFSVAALLLVFISGDAQMMMTSDGPRVFYTSADLTGGSLPGEIRSCYYHPIKDKVIVRLKDGTHKNIAVDLIWGFQPRNEYPTRIYKGTLYRLQYTQTFSGKTIYVYYQYVFRSSNFYFSTTLDSELLRLTKGNLCKMLDSSAYTGAMNDKYIRRRLQ